MNYGLKKNQWQNQRIKKKFLNRKSNSCCYKGYNYQIARKLRKKNLDNYCRNYNHFNDAYYINNYDNNILMNNDDINDDNDYIPEWQCTQCTFINRNLSFCLVCNKAFDYNYQNNLYYDQQQPLIIQYKSKKNRKEKRKNSQKNNKKQQQNTNTKKNILLANEEYMKEAEKYKKRLFENSKRKKQKKEIQCVDIEISVITAKYNEYEYVKKELMFNGDSFFMNIPLKLINTQLQRCSFKFVSNINNKQNIEWIHYMPDITDLFIPIFMTEYLFIYKYPSIPILLKNQNLFQMIENCLCECTGINTKIMMDNNNVSIISFNLDTILIEYIPSIDILINILCPLIGYKEILFIKANIKNVMININKKNLHLYSNNNAINLIRDSNLYRKKYHILRYENIKPRKQVSMENNQRSHDDNKTVENVDSKHVLFKAPYRYRRYSSDLDDIYDAERDKKWWNDVEYGYRRRNKYRGRKVYRYRLNINDKIDAKWGMNWYTGKVIQTAHNGVKIKYDIDNLTQFIDKKKYASKLRLISRSNRTRQIKTHYSKSNRR